MGSELHYNMIHERHITALLSIHCIFEGGEGGDYARGKWGASTTCCYALLGQLPKLF